MTLTLRLPNVSKILIGEVNSLSCHISNHDPVSNPDASCAHSGGLSRRPGFPRTTKVRQHTPLGWSWSFLHRPPDPLTRS